MNKLVFILLIMAIALSSCHRKDDKPFDATAQAKTDDATIQAYIKAHSIKAVKDTSGLYYQIITPGTGAKPTAESTVTVNYNGKLLDGTSFDSTDGRGPYTTQLTAVIPGWTIGVPLVKAGGKILLIIPSGLAYGSEGGGAIGPNSVLTFTIELLSVK